MEAGVQGGGVYRGSSKHPVRKCGLCGGCQLQRGEGIEENKSEQGSYPTPFREPEV